MRGKVVGGRVRSWTFLLRGGEGDKIGQIRGAFPYSFLGGREGREVVRKYNRPAFAHGSARLGSARLEIKAELK